MLLIMGSLSSMLSGSNDGMDCIELTPVMCSRRMCGEIGVACSFHMSNRSNWSASLQTGRRLTSDLRGESAVTASAELVLSFAKSFEGRRRSLTWALVYPGRNTLRRSATTDWRAVGLTEALLCCRMLSTSAFRRAFCWRRLPSSPSSSDMRLATAAATTWTARSWDSPRTRCASWSWSCRTSTKVGSLGAGAGQLKSDPREAVLACGAMQSEHASGKLKHRLLRWPKDCASLR
mmetsp:Transcript_82711/g.239000  ORF Transcript_82711/g.239000 Transcript_82711/m.239000 type:complete len:234 (+) Transcript_82711:1742-2443(+)